MSEFIARNNRGIKSLILIVGAIYGYVFMEWIFFVTKPSFMSILNIFQKAQVLLLTALILTLPALGAGVIVLGVKFLVGRIFKARDFSWLYALLPALILAALGLILIDNFTYTVFQFGVVSAIGPRRRLAYAGLFILLFLFSFRSLLKYIRSSSTISPRPVYLALALLVLPSLTLVFGTQFAGLGDRLGGPQSNTRLPNIILLGVDGVNAKSMSAYGYSRDTTPTIRAHAQDALVAENAFSNSGNTGGSLTSLLTGKLPTETRVLYPPDILMGGDAYQHLPGILKQLGYQTVQVTGPSYSDAYDRNLMGGFEIANSRAELDSPLFGIFSSIGGGNGVYFSSTLLQRITVRLNHIFLNQRMENAYETVTRPASRLSEEERFDAILSYLDDADGPIFLHAQMFMTHGPRFGPRKSVFSSGQEQTGDFMVDFYDDAILDFDSYFDELIRHLEETGKLDNTVLILYSDHGMEWDPLQRVPLMIWFPGKQYAGKINQNVQMIDIPPTILDFLGVPLPTWMTGRSILDENLSPRRSIFSMNVARDLVGPEDDKGWAVHQEKVSPPFYQLGEVNLILCNRWFSLNLRSLELYTGEVSESSAECQETDIPSPKEAKQIILQRLMDDGYDVSSMPAEIPVIPSSTENK